MKKVINTVAMILLSSVSFAATTQIECKDKNTGSAFLNGHIYIKNVDGVKTPVVSDLQILDAKASLRLAKDSAYKITRSDFSQYSFKTHPDNVKLVDPTYCFLCLNQEFDQNEYIGKNKKYIEQGFYSEINESIGGKIVLAFDHLKLRSQQAFKMTFIYNIDDYELPLNKKLICQIK